VLGGVLETVSGVGVALLVASLVEMALKAGSANSELDEMIAKLKEHARQTGLSEQADRIWADTLGGLIDRQKALNDALSKRLTTQAAVDLSDLAAAEKDRGKLEGEVTKQNERIRNLQKQLDQAKAAPVVGITREDRFASSTGKAFNISEAQSQLDKAKSDLATLNTALQNAEGRVAKSQVIIGQAQGAALADLSASAKRFADLERDSLATTFQALKLGTPDVAKASAAFDTLVAAMDDAAGAGVHFEDVKVKAADFALNLLHDKIKVSDYAKAVRDLAAALKEQAEAAKNAAKQHPTDPVKAFKDSVIGAEGTGPNRMGSSAAGYGQFMPGTFETYFKRLYPDQAAGLSNTQIDDLRNKRTIAEAVISAATNDYVKVLKAAGQQITEAGLYTVHLLGEPAARKFFAAAPQASTRSVLGNQVVNQNPFLGGTVEQARVAIAKRIGDSNSAISAGASAIQQTLNQGAADLARAIKEEQERVAHYQQEKDQLEGQVIDARRGTATTAYEAWQFETAANIAAHKRTGDQIAAEQEIGKLLPQEADELRKINNERARYRQQLVDQRLRQAQAAEAEQGYQRGRDFQTETYGAEAQLLQSEQGLARTADQRLQIEQRLIDLQFAEEKLKNQYIIDWAERVRANKDATDREKADAAFAESVAKLHQDTADQRHANATAANQQQNASPLQSFFQSIPQTSDEINNALESIATHGLQAFNEKLADAIVNFHSLGDVGRAALQGLEGDLIRLALQLIEQHTIGAALGAAATATTTAAAAAAGAAWAGPAAMASLATLGANAGPASAGIASTVALATVLGAPKAAGGRIFGPGGDTSDGILTPTSRDEFVIKANSARTLGYDVLQYINSTGELPRGFANGGAIRPMNLSASGGGSRGGFSPSDIMQLRSIVETAIRAMPDIKLYPTVDSGDMLRRGVDTTHGSRALQAHISDNSTKYKAVLNRPGA
jgi:hypothetical protein